MWSLLLLLFPVGLIVYGVWIKRDCRRRQADCRLLMEAESLVECGARTFGMTARCIKLKGHEDRGDPSHLFCADAEVREEEAQ